MPSWFWHACMASLLSFSFFLRARLNFLCVCPPEKTFVMVSTESALDLCAVEKRFQEMAIKTSGDGRETFGTTEHSTMPVMNSLTRSTWMCVVHKSIPASSFSLRSTCHIQLGEKVAAMTNEGARGEEQSCRTWERRGGGRRAVLM